MRLYFTAFRRAYGGFGATTNVAGIPSTLDLVHVRTGPTNLFDPRGAQSSTTGPLFGSVSGNIQAVRPPAWFPTNLSITGYYGGSFLASQTSPDENVQDVLLCAAPDLPRIANLKQDISSGPAPSTVVPYNPYGQQLSQSSRPAFSEFTALFPMAGKTWAIASVPSANMPPLPRGQPTIWNELVTQFSSYAEQFLVLSNDGLAVIGKRRAVDCLRDLIEAARRGGDENMITLFFEQYVNNGLHTFTICSRRVAPDTGATKHVQCVMRWQALTLLSDLAPCHLFLLPIRSTILNIVLPQMQACRKEALTI